jgi:phosphatidylserine/phosphatidylglycerophosphate/cardiolipin synthase-like enzyme
MLPVVASMIQSARRSIDIVQFILDLNPETDAWKQVRRLCDALARKSSEGVVVRVILAEFRTIQAGNINLNRAAFEYLTRAGVATKVFSPETGVKSIHAKMLLADRQEALVGSHNWSMGAIARNLERSVHVVSPAFVRGLARSFDYYWWRADQ